MCFADSILGRAGCSEMFRQTLAFTPRPSPDPPLSPRSGAGNVIEKSVADIGWSEEGAMGGMTIC